MGEEFELPGGTWDRKTVNQYARHLPHSNETWCRDLTCKKCYGAESAIKAINDERLTALRAKVAALEEEQGEAERLLRLTACTVRFEDCGDHSLAFLRKGHSPELADIAIAIELAFADARKGKK